MTNEIRFLIKVKNFDKIKAKAQYSKTVWYFDNYRITKIHDGANSSYHKTPAKYYGKVHKNNEHIASADALQEIKSWDRLCKFKLNINVKLPIVDGKKLYLEQIKVNPSKGKPFIFFSTEAETEDHLLIKPLLNKLPGVKVIRELGEVSLFDILNNRLYK